MTKEFARAHTILADGLPLETLLEPCTQSGPVTKAERRAAERKSLKAKHQAERQTGPVAPTKAESAVQSGSQGDERQEATSKSASHDPNATGEESGTGDQEHLGAKLGLAMSGLAMASAGESIDTTEEDVIQPTVDYTAEATAQATAHEEKLQTAVKMRQSIQ